MLAQVKMSNKRFWLLVWHKLKNGSFCWTIPGGKIEPGEDFFFQTTVREYFEEVGTKLDPSKLREISVPINNIKFNTRFFYIDLDLTQISWFSRSQKLKENIPLLGFFHVKEFSSPTKRVHHFIALSERQSEEQHFLDSLSPCSYKTTRSEDWFCILFTSSVADRAWRQLTKTEGEVVLNTRIKRPRHSPRKLSRTEISNTSVFLF